VSRQRSQPVMSPEDWNDQITTNRGSRQWCGLAGQGPKIRVLSMGNSDLKVWAGQTHKSFEIHLGQPDVCGLASQGPKIRVPQHGKL